jgi:type IV secretion system protein TrbL
MTILAPLGGALDGTLGGIASGNAIGGLISGATGSAGSAVLQWISSWVLKGTRGAIEEVASAIGAATAPNLNSTWFSSTYWRVAALAAMLTIPFLCAAAVQAVARADLSLLARVTFGYLPLSILGVSLAAPLTMLLLAATDQMSAAVSASAATGGARFLDHAAEIAGALATAGGGSPFFAVAVGMLALMAAMALAVELLVRAAAVYIVVLMLPLAFAAFVWPARRVWAVRLVELLASLILSKFVIVAVLSLASAAFVSGTPGIGELLVAMSLILLSTFAPWALMRVLPFTELASGAAGILRNELPVGQARSAALGVAGGAGELAMELPARLRNQARAMYAGHGGEQESTPAADAMPAAVASAAAAGPAARTEGSAEPSGSETGSSEPGVGSSEPNLGSSTSNVGPSASHTGSSDERPLFVHQAAWRGSEQRHLGAGIVRAAEQRHKPGPDQKEQP